MPSGLEGYQAYGNRLSTGLLLLLFVRVPCLPLLTAVLHCFSCVVVLPCVRMSITPPCCSSFVLLFVPPSSPLLCLCSQAVTTCWGSAVWASAWRWPVSLSASSSS